MFLLDKRALQDRHPCRCRQSPAGSNRQGAKDAVNGLQISAFRSRCRRVDTFSHMCSDVVIHLFKKSMFAETVVCHHWA